MPPPVVPPNNATNVTSLRLKDEDDNDSTQECRILATYADDVSTLAYLGNDNIRLFNRLNSLTTKSRFDALTGGQDADGGRAATKLGTMGGLVFAPQRGYDRLKEKPTTTGTGTATATATAAGQEEGAAATSVARRMQQQQQQQQEEEGQEESKISNDDEDKKEDGMFDSGNTTTTAPTVVFLSDYVFPVANFSAFDAAFAALLNVTQPQPLPTNATIVAPPRFAWYVRNTTSTQMQAAAATAATMDKVSGADAAATTDDNVALVHCRMVESYTTLASAHEHYRLFAKEMDALWNVSSPARLEALLSLMPPSSSNGTNGTAEAATSLVPTTVWPPEIEERFHGNDGDSNSTTRKGVFLLWKGYSNFIL